MEEPLTAITQSNNDNRFDLTLSVSTVTVATKKEAMKVLDFQAQAFAAKPGSPELEQLFKTQLYSTNTWSSGCNNAAYVGMTGVTLDFDHDFSIGEAQQAFADYNYILHTSRTHQYAGDGAPEDRFRVILPFAPSGLYYVNGVDARKVYSKLLDQYPHADVSCTNPGRKFFPSTRELDTPFLLDVHVTGRYFSVDIADAPDEEFHNDDTRVWDGALQPRSEMERVLKFCPFVRWMEAHIDDPTVHISEPLKYSYISNLCWYEGGAERIHQTLSRDVRPHKYDRDTVNDKIDRVRDVGPHKYTTIARLSPVNARLWGWPGDASWVGPASPAGWSKYGLVMSRSPIHKTGDIYIQYDDKLIVGDSGHWNATDLNTLKEGALRATQKLHGVCPFCDADTAEWGNDTFHFSYLWCPQCHQRYYEHPDSPGVFAFKGELMRVETRADKFVSIEQLQKENFRTDDDWRYARRLVLNDPDRKYLSEDFQIRRIGSVDFDRIGFDFDVNDNAIVFKYPARSVEVKDNGLVNAFIERLFGEYSEFIKDWMAMYCFTNYVKLPVIVLAGERFSGKNTFAEMMGKIFEKLMGYWDGDVCEFNPQFQSKLLFVDENRNATKPEQYVELKRITGNELIPINRKHKDVFYARNNLNIIFATNDAKPVALKWGEEPTDERVNNFFIHWCTSAEVVDNELKHKLWARIGHYVRTELRARYERLVANSDTRNRYFLAAPITPYALSIYASSKTSVEEETEILAECIVRGVVPRNPLEDEQPGDKNLPNFKPIKRPDKDEYHIPPRKLVKLIKALKLPGNYDLKAYMNTLVRMKVINPVEYRTETKRYGYPILRARDHYPESGPMIWDD
ncbi:MAG: hypothetical protein H6508_01755 [Calditrichaeota bacterium]|nr:hypothetical protein [Calditrichota bacterium]